MEGRSCCARDAFFRFVRGHLNPNARNVVQGVLFDKREVQVLRDYQERAVTDVRSAWSAGTRRVCLVAPTGGGKTRLGEELVADAPTLWIAHRRELLRQAAARLRSRFGRLDVGLIAPGEDFDPGARIQVATVQTLLARTWRPRVDRVVFDECHHFLADDWNELATFYANADLLGLTATPERRDGRSLGDLFDTLVVAASYSELIEQGHLVRCRVYQPPEALGSDLAQDPVIAYQRYAEGSRAFVFCSSVETAYRLAKRFYDEGIAAGTIEANTPVRERDEALERFARGEIAVLTNCFALTEGVDVPAARTVILARAFEHVTPFLQAAGRVLRPHAEKPDAILIDLVGATLVHGLPTEDREYSLEGKGIRRTSLAPLRNCPECGATVLAAQRRCPECGFEPPAEPRAQPRIYDLELRAVYAGSETPAQAKERELGRLRDIARERGWSVGWVAREYKKLFGAAPELVNATSDEKRTEYERLSGIAKEHGYKSGFVSARFKELFGHWPPREWALFGTHIDVEVS